MNHWSISAFVYFLNIWLLHFIIGDAWDYFIIQNKFCSNTEGKKFLLLFQSYQLVFGHFLQGPISNHVYILLSFDETALVGLNNKGSGSHLALEDGSQKRQPPRKDGPNRVPRKHFTCSKFFSKTPPKLEGGWLFDSNSNRRRAIFATLDGRRLTWPVVLSLSLWTAHGPSQPSFSDTLLQPPPQQCGRLTRRYLRWNVVQNFKSWHMKYLNISKVIEMTKVAGLRNSLRAGQRLSFSSHFSSVVWDARKTTGPLPSPNSLWIVS